jgi:predicted DNA-binding transcriptional regulator AlpA
MDQRGGVTMPRPLPAERLWSVDDVSAFLGVPVETLYQWRKRHYGPRAGRVGRHLRYEQDEVRAWFKSLVA